MEVESGKKIARPQLKAALAYCRKHKTKLIITKLDRLARNVHFISGLMESGVDFVACDMPQADRFMLHVYAAMAEEEGRRISERTKATLAAAKERGIELGPNGKLLAKQNRIQAVEFARTITNEIDKLGLGASVSLRKVASALNDPGVRTRSGSHWHPTSIARVIKRID